VGPAKPGDVGYVRDLSRRVFQQYGPYEEMVTRWFDSGTTVTYLALAEKRPTGFIMLGGLRRQVPLSLVSEVLAIAVEPARWRCGIGSLLMKEIFKRAREKAVETLVLHTATENVPGQRLFKKCGFVPCRIEEAFYPAGQDALVMFKDLSSQSPSPCWC
jgi:ribosomal-protein-alanine N-acetyltransferase